MDALLDYPAKDRPALVKLRKSVGWESPDPDGAMKLAKALVKVGCYHESAFLLRPLKKQWGKTPDADWARSVLAEITWVNKHFKDFVIAKNAGKFKEAKAILGERWLYGWDRPPLLMHLGDIARKDKNLDLSDHIYERAYYLSQRGLPNVDYKMDAFEYASQSCLVENLLNRGDVKEATKWFKKVKPNPGNAMSHEIQGVEILMANKQHDEAIKSIAHMIITAKEERKGWSRDIRLKFIKEAKELAPLRKRKDWQDLLDNPKDYR